MSSAPTTHFPDCRGHVKRPLAAIKKAPDMGVIALFSSIQKWNIG